jgi:CysZ protein
MADIYDTHKGRVWESPFYILKGAKFLYNNRALWKYAAAPVGIGSVILGGSYALLFYLVRRLFSGYSSEAWFWQVLWYILMIVLVALFVVVFFFIFTRMVSAISSPFNDLLSQKTEALVTGTFDDTPFSIPQLIKDSARAIGHSFKILGLYIVLMIISLSFMLIPGVGSVLFTVFGALLSSFMYAYEYLGYPMDRKRFSWGEKKAFLRKRFKYSIGFGLGCLAGASIPVVNIMFVPAAAVGGALLFMDINRPDVKK